MAHSRVSEPKQVRGTLIHGGRPESNHNTEGLCTKGNPSNMGSQGKHEKEAIYAEGSLTNCTDLLGARRPRFSKLGVLHNHPQYSLRLAMAGPERAASDSLRPRGVRVFNELPNNVNAVGPGPHS